MYKVDLLPAQRKLFEVPEGLNFGDKDVAVYQGGYGSGKTFCGSLLGILLALKYPGIIGLVGAFTFTLLRDTTLKMYLQHLDNLKIKYNYNKAESLITLPNGSEIYFKHFQRMFEFNASITVIYSKKIVFG